MFGDFVIRPEPYFRNTVRRAMQRSESRKVAGEHDELAPTPQTPSRLRHNDKRHHVEAKRKSRVERLAQQTQEKLIQAQMRREQRLREQSEAFENRERIRVERQCLARERRGTHLLQFAEKVTPLIMQFRESGLVLQGGASSIQEIQDVLRNDTWASCDGCAEAAPKTATCPVTKKRHTRTLIHLATGILTEIENIRTVLHNEKIHSCAIKMYNGETDSSSASCNSGVRQLQAFAQWFPLAFHEATEMTESRGYAARNVVIIFEEVFLALDAISAQETSESDAERWDLCEHLRHCLSRFVRSWHSYTVEMENMVRQKSPTRAPKADLARQLIDVYAQLTIVEYWRAHNTASSTTQRPGVKERRQELSSAIDSQLSELRREIRKLGAEDLLFERLRTLDYSSSSSPSSSSRRSAVPKATLPRMNSADWCDDSLHLTEDEDVESVKPVPPPVAPAAPVRRQKRVTRSSAAFRAQIAADRQKALQKKKEQHWDPVEGDCDGDEDE